MRGFDAHRLSSPDKKAHSVLSNRPDGALCVQELLVYETSDSGARLASAPITYVIPNVCLVISINPQKYAIESAKTRIT